MKSFSGIAKHYVIFRRQITTTLAIIFFALSGLSVAQVNTNPQTFTISGNVGIPGVVMRSDSGGTVSSGSDGSYSITVPSGWSGGILPQKDGYTFLPPAMIYSDISSNVSNQNYVAKVKTFTISGTTGISGVEMQGLPGNVVTGPDGSYTVTLDYGFSGTVKPVKEGFNFAPSDRRYSKISNNFTNQDYKAALNVYTISGTTGVAGVRMNGLPGNLITDRNGSYKVMVEYGWMGTVTPEKRGYKFEPASRTYNKVAEDNIRENYLANVNKFVISGTIVSDKGEPVEGVRFEKDNIPVVTDAKGRYSIEVDYGWTGVLRPEKEGFIFSPAFMQNLPVTRDMANQNFKAQMRMLTISDTIEIKDRPIQGINITANPGDIKTVTDAKGQYSIQVPYGWSGEMKFSKLGIDFNPDTKAYNNVTTDIINGIPVPATNVTETVLQYPENLRTLLNRPVGRRILFVPSDDIDSKDIAETKEDILVMAEILDERFREPRLIGGVLTDFGDFFGRDNQQTEAIYLQGYGLVFMMEINYQFSLLSQLEEEVEYQTNSDTDQTWEQARQRVLSGNTETENSAGKYDKQMVEILKTELIRTLKYASNVRNIKPDEWVIVSVSGSSYGGGMMGGYGGGMMGGYGGGMIGGYGASSPAAMTGGYGNLREQFFPRSLAANIMTMRVKKSDVDEFANEKIDFEKFREKVQILIN